MKRIDIAVRYSVLLLSALLILCFTFTDASCALTDTQAPSAPKGLTAVSVTHTSVTLSWTASKDNVKVTGYQIYRDGRKISSSSKTTYTNSHLVPGRTYAYEVRAYDAAGNVSESSNILTVSTISDSQSPSAPEDLKADWVTFTSVSLSWRPSTDNVGIKGYEIYCNGKKAASTSSTSYEYKKLTPGTTNTFFVKAYDEAGNYSPQSREITVNTIADSTPPSAPSGLKVSSVSLTEVNLTWSPSSDNVKVRDYDILRDGVKIGTSTKTSYCSKGLFPGKNYTYTVRAVDISGNMSGSSNQVIASTLKDQQAPDAPSELKATSVKGYSVSLQWTASTDNVKVAGYQIYCNGIVISTSTGTSRTVRNPFGPGYVEFYVKSYDQSGNLSDSSNTITVFTPSE